MRALVAPTLDIMEVTDGDWSEHGTLDELSIREARGRRRISVTLIRDVTLGPAKMATPYLTEPEDGVNPGRGVAPAEWVAAVDSVCSHARAYVEGARAPATLLDGVADPETGEVVDEADLAT